MPLTSCSFLHLPRPSDAIFLAYHQHQPRYSPTNFQIVNPPVAVAMSGTPLFSLDESVVADYLSRSLGSAVSRMNFEIHPIPWGEFPYECLFYFYFISILHAVVLTVVCFIIAALPRKQPGRLLRRIGRFSLFMILLLIAGMLFNGLWSCLIWGRLYYSADYVFDFIPIWPVTQSTIDATFGTERGRLLGVSLWELQMVWLLFALGTWAVTISLYLWLRRAVDRMRRRGGLTIAALAVILPLSSFVTAASIWVLVAPDRMYHYRYGDPGPVGGFIPPFPNPWKDLGLANAPGYYIWPAWTVYATWLGFVLVALAIPAFILWQIARDQKKARGVQPA